MKTIVAISLLLTSIFSPTSFAAPSAVYKPIKFITNNYHITYVTARINAKTSVRYVSLRDVLNAYSMIAPSAIFCEKTKPMTCTIATNKIFRFKADDQIALQSKAPFTTDMTYKVTQNTTKLINGKFMIPTDYLKMISPTIKSITYTKTTVNITALYVNVGWDRPRSVALLKDYLYPKSPLFATPTPSPTPYPITSSPEPTPTNTPDPVCAVPSETPIPSETPVADATITNESPDVASTPSVLPIAGCTTSIPTPIEVVIPTPTPAPITTPIARTWYGQDLYAQADDNANTNFASFRNQGIDIHMTATLPISFVTVKNMKYTLRGARLYPINSKEVTDLRAQHFGIDYVLTHGGMDDNQKITYILRADITLENVGSKTISSDYSLGGYGSGLMVAANNNYDVYCTSIGHDVGLSESINDTNYLSDYNLVPSQRLDTTEYYWVVGEPGIFGVYEYNTFHRFPFAATIK